MSSDVIEPPFTTPHPDAAPDAAVPRPASSEDAPAASEPGVLPRSGSTDDLGLALIGKPDPLLGEFDPESPRAPVVAEAAVDSEAPLSSAELEALDVEPRLPLQPVQPPGSFEVFGPLLEQVPPAPAEAAVEAPVPEPEEPTQAAPAGPSHQRVAESPIPETPNAPAVAEFTTIPPEVVEPPAASAEPAAEMISGIDLSTPAPAPQAAAEAIGGIDLSTPAPTPEPAAEAFGGIDLSAPPTATSAPKPKAAADEDEEEDDDYVDEPEGMSLGFVLLMSYASAVTIGLLYVLITGRTLKHSDDADFLPPVDERVDPGQRAKFSRKLAPPPPIKPEHLTTIGKPVRMGSLEVTPLAMTTGPIELKHLINAKEMRKDGQNALKLRLRFKNISKDLIFAPLDEAFLREREAGVTDSFIEIPNGRNIELHSLALTSEWEIAGQEFKELKPGESFESSLVSASDALDHKAPEMTWRIRLRTGIDQTDYLGVKCHDSEIKPGS